jgi:hypothetical protein
MSERQKQSQFLKGLLGLMSPRLGQALQHEIRVTEQTELRLKHLSLMLLTLILLAAAGLGYTLVLGSARWEGQDRAVRLTLALGIAFVVCLGVVLHAWFKNSRLQRELFAKARELLLPRSTNPSSLPPPLGEALSLMPPAVLSQELTECARQSVTEARNLVAG